MAYLRTACKLSKEREVTKLDLRADTPAGIVVCIPTYKRPDQLRALLDAISRQSIAKKFGVIIGNNHHQSIGSVYKCIEDIDFIEELIVEAKGVSIVRNALIAAALNRSPSPRWIAFIDDDQLPAVDWLQNLLGTAERFGADMTGGPVRKVPVQPGFWSSAAGSHAAPRPEGKVSMLNEAGNLLLSTRYLRSLDRLPFSPTFGQTGGEDFEFFLYSARRGARMYWSPLAHVIEGLPEQRTSLAGLVTRSYRQYAYQTRARRLHLGLGGTLRFLAKHFAATPLVFARSLVDSKSPRLALGLTVRRTAGLFGSVAGLLGAKPTAYGQ